jgi:hypothetical protein
MADPTEGKRQLVTEAKEEHDIEVLHSTVTIYKVARRPLAQASHQRFVR